MIVDKTMTTKETKALYNWYTVKLPTHMEPEPFDVWLNRFHIAIDYNPFKPQVKHTMGWNTSEKSDTSIDFVLHTNATPENQDKLKILFGIFSDMLNNWANEQ